MKLRSANKPRSWQQRAIFAGAAGLALAGANLLIARRTERKNAPRGSFLTVNGTRLHYTDRGEGTPIVLVHGNAVTGDDWNISGVADLLLKSHRVIIFDRPGFGHSERPRGHLWTAVRQADLIHDALLQLKVEQPVLVGHSLGTIVALALAERYQADIAALVLLSGYYFWTLRPDVLLATPGALPVLGDILRYTVSPVLGWLQMPVLKWSMFSPAPVSDRFQDRYSTAMALRPSQLRATSVDGALMIQGALALRDQYKDLTLPVVIIAGSGDKVVFKRMSERLHACLSNSVLHIVEGAGHMVHYFAPQQVAAAIEGVAYIPGRIAAR